ncbi:hypothetical protein QQG55_24975 [Brugia pahangi]|uniref:Uncharacterized protein n=1 Tax=Brugia pahangi TaxID=6280 RepID=A0A0N4T0I4_BRUPA|nr:unnamed protein product [Brugia pahangi]
MLPLIQLRPDVTAPLCNCRNTDKVDVAIDEEHADFARTQEVSLDSCRLLALEQIAFYMIQRDYDRNATPKCAQ